jgi:hypothetical protein
VRVLFICGKIGAKRSNIKKTWSVDTLWQTNSSLLKMASYSGFSHYKWWFSIVM